MNFTLLLWILIFFIILAYCLWSEDRSQNCVETCINQAPVALPSDTPVELKEKIREGTMTIYNTVDWRKAMIIAVSSIFFILIIAFLFKWPLSWSFSKGSISPRGIDLVIALLTVFIISYFAFIFMQERFWKPISIQIREAADLL